jgi:hypothetical protein
MMRQQREWVRRVLGKHAFLACGALTLLLACVLFVACTGHDCTDDGNCTQASDGGGGGAESSTVDGTVGDTGAPMDGGTDGADAGPSKIVIDRMTFDFGTIETGTKSAAATFTLTNAGGAMSSALTAKMGGAGATLFTADATGCTKSLAPGASCAITVVFAPSAVGLENATLTVEEAAAPVAISALTGTGAASGGLTVTPLSQDFGVVVAGSRSADQSFLVTNTGASATGTLTASLTGTDGSQFKLSTDGCSTTTLAAGATCTIVARLAPTLPGARAASLAITGSPGGTATAPLAGVGVSSGQLTISPTSFAFNGTQDGTDGGTQDFSITNTALDPTGVMATSIDGTNGADFKVQADGCSGKPLMSGASCIVTVAFAPATAGAKVASVSVTGAPGGAVAAGLSGTGLAGASLKITPSPENFGTVVKGVGSTVTLTVTNVGGVASGIPVPSLGGADVGDFALGTSTCTAALQPKDTCTVPVTLTASSAGTKNGTLTVTGSPGGAPMVALTANAVLPGSLSVTPSPYDFGPIPVNASSGAQTFTVTNTGGAASGMPVPSFTGNGANQFAISNNMCAAGLAPNGTCTFDVKFVPTVEGPESPSLTVNATPGGPAVGSVTGFGQSAASLSITPSALFPQSFADTVTNAVSPIIPFTVSNDGDLATDTITISLAGTDPGQFKITNNMCPASLSGHTSCEVDVAFAPTNTSPPGKSATFNASALTGGTPPPVSLSGNALNPANIVVSSTPNPYDFGIVEIGVPTTTTSIVFKNTGDVATGTISSVVSSNTAELNVVTDNCTTHSLGKNVTCNVIVKWTAQPAGLHSQTLTVNAPAGGPTAATVQATGKRKLTVNWGTVAASRTWLQTSDGTITQANCTTSPCTAFFADGAAITLQARTSGAAGAPYYHFSSFSGSGGCSGSFRDCALTMNQSRTVTATFSPTTYNLMFVTNATFTANKYAPGGLASSYNADCNAAATAAGINDNSANGAFVAWMSDSDSTGAHKVANQLVTATGTFVRLDDKIFSLSRNAMLNSEGILNPPNISETGATIHGSAWTNTLDAGGTYGSGSSCTNWTVNTGSTATGRTDTGPGLWTAGNATACSGSQHIYCFQNTLSALITPPAPPVTSATVKLAYYTVPTWTPGGAMSATQVCNTYKPTGYNDMNHVFVALQATDQATGASLFNTGASYYRPDGIFIATGADLAAGNQITSGIWQRNDLTYAGGEVRPWTGALSSTTVGINTTDCGIGTTAWSDGSAASTNGTVGEANSTTASYFTWLGSQACNGAWPVYCIQQ